MMLIVMANEHSNPGRPCIEFESEPDRDAYAAAAAAGLALAQLPKRCELYQGPDGQWTARLHRDTKPTLLVTHGKSAVEALQALSDRMVEHGI